METPPVKFTVVMTVAKRLDYVPHALQSVAWQTYPNWELILLEDGKHLFCRGVFQSLLRSRPVLLNRCRYVECDMPEGVAGPWGHALRRQGLAAATGHYVAWLNHDNLLHPEFLQLHYENVCKADPCVSLVPVDYWQRHQFLRRVPVGWEAPDRMKPGDLDLLCMALPAKEARDAEAFDEKYDDVREAGYHAYERLARRLPVHLNGRLPGGAHF